MTEQEKDTLDPDAAALMGRLFDIARGVNSEDPETLGQYIDAGINADIRNQDGNTFLMLAAYTGNVDALKVLIARHADVDALNDRGQSPLAGAIFKKEPEVVEMLIAAGADPYAGHPNAIDTARVFGQDELAQRLENLAQNTTN